MKEFTAATVESVSGVSALGAILNSEHEYPGYVGLDVHKDTIAVAVARRGRSEPRSLREIANTSKAVAKLVARLSREFDGEVLQWCDEAGPRGYGLYIGNCSVWVTAPWWWHRHGSHARRASV